MLNSDSDDTLNDQPNDTDWLVASFYILLYLSALLVFLVGFSWAAFITMIMLCYFRVFAITGFYHRYFSHRAYKTNRFFQFIFAIIGATAMQGGPIWWASHHRRHHANADKA